MKFPKLFVENCRWTTDEFVDMGIIVSWISYQQILNEKLEMENVTENKKYA